MICVRFGMVDDNLDLEELIGLVTSAGEELEESSKVIEKKKILYFSFFNVIFLCNNGKFLLL